MFHFQPFPSVLNSLPNPEPWREKTRICDTRNTVGVFFKDPNAVFTEPGEFEFDLMALHGSMALEPKWAQADSVRDWWLEIDIQIQRCWTLYVVGILLYIISLLCIVIITRFWAVSIFGEVSQNYSAMLGSFGAVWWSSEFFFADKNDLI